MHKEHKLIIALLVVILLFILYKNYSKKAEFYQQPASAGECGVLARNYCSDPSTNTIGNYSQVRNIARTCGKGYTLGKASRKCGVKPWMTKKSEAPLRVVRKIAYPPLEYPQI